MLKLYKSSQGDIEIAFQTKNCHDSMLSFDQVLHLEIEDQKSVLQEYDVV